MNVTHHITHSRFQHPTLSYLSACYLSLASLGEFSQTFRNNKCNSADEMSPPKDANANNQSLGLEIAFDRPSRTYHPGERVTGKLIVNPNGISPVQKQTKIPVQG